MSALKSGAPNQALRLRPRIWMASAAVAAALLARAATPEVEVLPIAPLRWNDKPLSAHTQGLEVINGDYYVTARREDVQPRRALLLRYTSQTAAWTVWDLTPTGDVVLDHPGGFQSDGRRLWIPFAESRRNGKSRVRAYRLDEFARDRTPKPDLEFDVDDHIGALAVSTDRGLLIGAAWDTDSVYVWDLQGRLKQARTGRDLVDVGLGSTVEGRRGSAIQDWKFVDGNLVGSGLIRVPGTTTPHSVSRVLRLTASLDPLPPSFDPPPKDGIPLSREGMAVAGGWIWFLPGDLGATNRLFRIPWHTAFGGPDLRPH